MSNARELPNKWGVFDNEMKDYPFWQEMLVKMKSHLDAETYSIILFEVTEKFGIKERSSVKPQDSRYSQVMSDKKKEEKEGIKPLTGDELKKELDIWTFDNLLKYFTEYMLEYAKENPNADISKKGTDIKNNVLNKLMDNVVKRRSSLNLATYSEEKDNKLSIFFKNVGHIIANIRMLKEPIEYTFDIEGLITITKKQQPVVEQAAPPAQPEESCDALKKEVIEVLHNYINSGRNFIKFFPAKHKSYADNLKIKINKINKKEDVIALLEEAVEYLKKENSVRLLTAINDILKSYKKAAVPTQSGPQSPNVNGR